MEIKKAQRNSAIELLRIIAMIMIIFHHFAGHSGLEWGTNDFSAPHLWDNFIIMGGKVGVNLFVLISGYFLVNSKGKIFNFPRILKFWGQVFFYSVSIFMVFLLTRKIDFGIMSFIESLFPITFSLWWFASTYFVMYLIHPFLNKLLNSLDKKQYQGLIVMTVICWSIIPTFTTTEYQGNNLLWFVTLYSIAGYIRKFGLNPKIKSKHYFGLWVLFTILTYLTSVAFVVLGTKSNFFSEHVRYFYDQEKLTILLISLSLFMAFVTMKMNYHKWINIVASATFGVYLIHDHRLVRSFLWMDLFKNIKYQDSFMLIPYSLFAVGVVFVVCAAIDLIRQKVFEKPFMFLVNKYSESLLKPFAKIIDVCKNVVFGKSEDE